MSLKLPVNNFEWIKDTSQCFEDFIKRKIMKKVMNDIFVKFTLNILKNYIKFVLICHSKSF